MIKRHVFSRIITTNRFFCLFIIFLLQLSPVPANPKHKFSIGTFQLAKKKEWLSSYGEQIWIGRAPDKTPVQACRKNEYEILYLRAWGIAKVISSVPIIYCPIFFSHYPKKYNPRK